MLGNEPWTMNLEPFTSIENPTLAHFRNFSSLFTPSPLYICREFSTNHLLFMQNKPNLVRRRRIANSVCTTNYENKSNWTLSENKPNSNPIKPNLRKAKMNVNSIITKDYRKKEDFVVRINKPNSRNVKNERKRFFTKGLWKWTTLRPQKTNPKQTQFPCVISLKKRTA